MKWFQAFQKELVSSARAIFQIFVRQKSYLRQYRKTMEKKNDQEAYTVYQILGQLPFVATSKR